MASGPVPATLAKGRPGGVKVCGAAPHVDHVVVSPGEGAGADHAEPLIVERQGFAAEEAAEEPHDLRGLRRGLEDRRARELPRAAQERTSRSGSRSPFLQWTERSICPFRPDPRESPGGRPRNFALRIVQFTDQEVAVLLHPLAERRHVAEEVICLPQRAEDPCRRAPMTAFPSPG